MDKRLGWKGARPVKEGRTTLGLGCESLNPDGEEDGYVAATGKRSEEGGVGMEGRAALSEVMLHGRPLLPETIAFAHNAIPRSLFLSM